MYQDNKRASSSGLSPFIVPAWDFTFTIVSYEASGHTFTAAMWVRLLNFCDEVIGRSGNKAE